MVRVLLSSELQPLAGGVAELTFEAADVRALFDQLHRRYPALAEHVQAHSALAIDGVIYQRPFAEPLKPHCEIYFIPRIAAG